jgi:hypothetical protein
MWGKLFAYRHRGLGFNNGRQEFAYRGVGEKGANMDILILIAVLLIAKCILIMFRDKKRKKKKRAKLPLVARLVGLPLYWTLRQGR